MVQTMTARLCLAATLLASATLCQPSWAETPANVDPTTAPAQAMIDSQNAKDAFRALPNPNARLVMHIQSGMPCLIANGTEGVLTLFKPDGTDVGCEQKQPNGVSVAMFAMYLPDTKLDDAMASQMRSAMRWRWTKPPQNLSPTTEVKEAGLPYNTGRVGMIGELDGVRSMVRIAAAKTPDGWVVMQRFVAPVSVGGSDEGRSITMGFGGADNVMNETMKFMARQRAANAAPSH